MRIRQRQKKGFTLVEVLVAIFILAIMAMISGGIYLAFTQSQLRAKAAQNILSTSQFVLENVSRDIRNSIIVNYDGSCPLVLTDGNNLTNCMILQREDGSYFAYTYYNQQLYYLFLTKNGPNFDLIDLAAPEQSSVALGFASNLLVSQWRTRVTPSSDPFVDDPGTDHMYQPRVTIFLATSYPGARAIETMTYFFQTTVVSRVYKK